MSKKIFISHASADKDLVQKFVNLLSSGSQIMKPDIFCSSLTGMGIPAGEHFIEYIRKELESTGVVIALISKNYLNSQVCLCELGAAWVQTTTILPIIIPPCNFKDIDGVIHGIQGIRINDTNDLNVFIDSLNSKIKNKSFNHSIWETEKKAFLEEVETIIASLPKPKIISESEYEKLQKEFEDSEAAVNFYHQKNIEQNKLIEELKKAKDKKECDEIINSNLPEKEQFDKILEDTRKVLNRNNTVVNYALYLYFSSGEDIIIHNYVKQKELADEARDASENKYLNMDDTHLFSLNLEDCKVSRSIEQINSLKNYMDEKLTDEIFNNFVEEYEFKPDITNKRFWTEVLDFNIDRY